MPKNTPLEIKALDSLTLKYSDGTEETYIIEGSQGFHRVNEYISPNKVKVFMHEVFFTYADTGE